MEVCNTYSNFVEEAFENYFTSSRRRHLLKYQKLCLENFSSPNNSSIVLAMEITSINPMFNLTKTTFKDTMKKIFNFVKDRRKTEFYNLILPDCCIINLVLIKVENEDLKEEIKEDSLVLMIVHEGKNLARVLSLK